MFAFGENMVNLYCGEESGFQNLFCDDSRETATLNTLMVGLMYRIGALTEGISATREMRACLFTPVCGHQ